MAVCVKGFFFCCCFSFLSLFSFFPFFSFFSVSAFSYHPPRARSSLDLAAQRAGEAPSERLLLAVLARERGLAGAEAGPELVPKNLASQALAAHLGPQPPLENLGPELGMTACLREAGFAKRSESVSTVPGTQNLNRAWATVPGMQPGLAVGQEASSSLLLCQHHECFDMYAPPMLLPPMPSGMQLQ